MPYIHAVKGSIIALILFAVLAYFYNGEVSSKEVELILTISTFLFAISAGFFLTRLNKRYDKIRETVAAEDSHFISLFETAESLRKETQKKLVKLIDEYYIIVFDYDLGNYKKPSQKVLSEMYNVVEDEKIKTRRDSTVMSRLLQILEDIDENRNKSHVINEEKLTRGQWLVLIVLAIIIIVTTYLLKIDLAYSGVFKALLSSVLILIILIMRDLQNLVLTGQTLLIESGQEVFDMIGMSRYYNIKYFESGTIKVPKEVKEYRLGLHKAGEKRNIKLVKNKKE